MSKREETQGIINYSLPVVRVEKLKMESYVGSQSVPPKAKKSKLDHPGIVFHAPSAHQTAGKCEMKFSDNTEVPKTTIGSDQPSDGQQTSATIVVDRSRWYRIRRKLGTRRKECEAITAELNTLRQNYIAQLLEKDAEISNLTDTLKREHDKYIEQLVKKDAENSKLTDELQMVHDKYIDIITRKDKQIESLNALIEDLESNDERSKALQESKELLRNLRACNNILASKNVLANPEGSEEQDTAPNDSVGAESDNSDDENSNTKDIGDGVRVEKRVIAKLADFDNDSSIDKFTKARKKLLCLYSHVFTIEEFATHSRTGKAGRNSTEKPKPRLDPTRVFAVKKHVAKESDEDVKKRLDKIVNEVLKNKCSNTLGTL